MTNDGDYRALFERSAMPLWVVDEETQHFLAVNDATVEKYGWSREELLRMRASDVRCDEEVEATRADYRAYLSPPREGAAVVGPIRHRRKDGSRIEVRVESMRVEFAGRRSLLSTIMDETGRRRLEERHLEIDRLWRAFVESSPDMVVVLSPDGTVQFINRPRPPFEAEVIVGRKIWDFTPEPGAEGRLSAVLQRLVETREAFRYEGRGYPYTNESPRWYEVSVIPVTRGAVVERILWIAADVTARKSLEEQLRQSQKLEAVGLLAGGVAHDFNNLLAIIMGSAEASLGRLPPGHPLADELREVVDASRRGGELTRKLLAFSRKQVIQPVPLDMHDVVRGVTRLLARVLGADVELEVEREDGTLVVTADAVQLEQVLLNLCTNARQAMPNGGRLTLRTRSATFDGPYCARHAWARPGSFAEITVTDTGVGIEESIRARLFEPFFTTKTEGTGLGLATVHGIVQQHGGFVNVESVVGAGATFSVYLPISSQQCASQGPLTAHTPRDEGRGELVLLVEDETALRSLVSTTLQDLGYRVLEAADGEEAATKYAEQAGSIALVVLDVVLPRLAAPEVYARMRAVRSDVKVLLTTGYAPESARIDSLLREQGIPLLEKPFSRADLAAKVRGAIDGRPGPATD